MKNIGSILTGLAGGVVAFAMLFAMQATASHTYPTSERTIGNGNDIILDAEGDNSIDNSNNAVTLFKVDGTNVLQLQSTVLYVFRDINFSNRGIKALGGVFDLTPDTIAADDATPVVNAGVFFLTSDNTGATAITDLDSPTAGQIVWICIGGTGSNASTIADSGNFNLSAAWSPGLDDCIQLYVVADNEYIELSRSDN